MTKVALVYDRVNKWGGAERLLLAIHQIFPQAPLYTSLYNPKTAPWAKVFNVHPSPLNKFSLLRTRHEHIPFLMPFAFESFDFSSYEIVISITSAEAKGIITKPGTFHLCYCLTPTRYLYMKNFPPLKPLKAWDQVALHRPDNFIAISELVRHRIKKFYQAEAPIVFPPLDENLVGQPINRSSYFLSVSRLVPYKRLDLVIKAANHMQFPLKIVGTGRDYARLKKLSGKNVEFLGFIEDKVLSRFYSEALAVVIPGEEDFCLTAIEAQANGTPVIAYQKSGVGETVVDGVTGFLFDSQSQTSLESAINKFSRINISPSACKQNAQRFSFANFRRTFLDQITNLYEKYQKRIQ